MQVPTCMLVKQQALALRQWTQLQVIASVNPKQPPQTRDQ